MNSREKMNSRQNIKKRCPDTRVTGHPKAGSSSFQAHHQRMETVSRFETFRGSHTERGKNNNLLWHHFRKYLPTKVNLGSTISCGSKTLCMLCYESMNLQVRTVVSMSQSNWTRPNHRRLWSTTCKKYHREEWTWLNFTRRGWSNNQWSPSAQNRTNPKKNLFLWIFIHETLSFIWNISVDRIVDTELNYLHSKRESSPPRFILLYLSTTCLGACTIHKTWFLSVVPFVT